MQNKDLYIAIDANAIVHRAYHAYPSSLATNDGRQVNAVYGFTVMLLELLRKYNPKYLIATFDTAKPTFRHTKFPDYKATRKPIDNELLEQFPYVREVLDAFNIPSLSVEGYEADDILGTLAEFVENG
ncbi:MAG TPA: DNA polymerase I, partial [bacterium]|nr:DNA polymerase I [bacterium]